MPKESRGPRPGDDNRQKIGRRKVSGHFKIQRYGKGLAETKRVFIGPYVARVIKK